MAVGAVTGFNDASIRYARHNIIRLIARGKSIKLRCSDPAGYQGGDADNRRALTRGEEGENHSHAARAVRPADTSSRSFNIDNHADEKNIAGPVSK